MEEKTTSCPVCGATTPCHVMGLGKPVIQLCQEGVQLHFDIAQKNTIMWASVEDIPERLRKRIIATIE